VAVLHDLVWF